MVNSTACLPEIGEMMVFVERTGYRLFQCRPLGCRYGCCRCGTCDGAVTEYVCTVARVIHYADNSVVVVGIDADGHVHQSTLVAPHGDAC
jgi:hypothetical protein